MNVCVNKSMEQKHFQASEIENFNHVQQKHVCMSIFISANKQAEQSRETLLKDRHAAFRAPSDRTKKYEAENLKKH